MKLRIVNGNRIIANMFSQRGFDTDYEAMEKCLKWLVSNYPGKSIALPFGIGCGIANGDWDRVYGIIEGAFKESAVTLYKFAV